MSFPKMSDAVATDMERKKRISEDFDNLFKHPRKLRRISEDETSHADSAFFDDTQESVFESSTRSRMSSQNSLSNYVNNIKGDPVKGARTKGKILRAPAPMKCVKSERKVKDEKKGIVKIEQSANHNIRNNRSFQCVLCKKIFENMRTLKSHIDRNVDRKGRFFSHERSNQTSCSICGRECNQQYALTQHMRNHNFEKLHRCQVCEKRFKQKGNLKSHMRIHSGETPFKCPTCDMAFRYKATRTTHMKRCSEPHPFACTQCNLKFITSGALTGHMRSHKVEVVTMKEPAVRNPVAEKPIAAGSGACTKCTELSLKKTCAKRAALPPQINEEFQWRNYIIYSILILIIFFMIIQRF